MNINYHEHGIKIINCMFSKHADDYDQLRRLSTMVLGASFMLDPASTEGQELETLRQKIEARINEVLGVNDYLDADALCHEQTMARAEAAKPLLPRNGSAAMRI